MPCHELVWYIKKLAKLKNIFEFKKQVKRETDAEPCQIFNIECFEKITNSKKFIKLSSSSSYCIFSPPASLFQKYNFVIILVLKKDEPVGRSLNQQK